MYDPQIMIIEQRVGDLRREAQRESLARRVRGKSRRALPAFSIKVAVGQQLVRWGQQLQGEHVTPPQRTKVAAR